MEEEEETEVTEFSGTVLNVIELLRQAHHENGRLHYYATADPRQRGHRIMPVTPLVFELFIYNSIYQVDWPASLKARRVENHPRDVERGFSETRQQLELERFLKRHVRGDPALLYKAFISIRDASLEGDWTAVVPDERISAEDGERFFERLRSLRETLRGTERPELFRATTRAGISLLSVGVTFISSRNNIFHGSKTLAETYDPNQRQRIELYLAFIRCVNHMFFLVCDKISRRDGA